MKLAISISTYMRQDGKTAFYLERAISSVFNQKHQEFKLFLIGDHYENNDELINIVSKFPSNKIFLKNLPVANEREKYTNKKLVWLYGGVNAVNQSISFALNEGFEYICHLDHDDYWESNHLSEINECILTTGSSWMCTKSTHGISNSILPNFQCSSKLLEAYPFSSKLIHSSVCMNFKKIPLRYRDVFAEEGKPGLPADADLWERTRVYLKSNNLKSYYINSLTCRHDEEGYSKK
jgi:glycosyltransferase involved in cell wall biosynthesis